MEEAIKHTKTIKNRKMANSLFLNHIYIPVTLSPFLLESYGQLLILLLCRSPADNHPAFAAGTSSVWPEDKLDDTLIADTLISMLNAN